MSSLHILLIGPAWPYRGGPALFMTFLYQALSKSYRVDFINFRMMYPRFLFPGTTPLDISQDHYPKVPGPRLLHTLNPWYWWKTAQHIRKLSPDIIVFDWYQPFFGPMYFGIGLFLPSFLRKRIVFITENVISHEARWVDKFLTRMGLYWANSFIALSHQVEMDVRHFSRSKPVFRSELPIFSGYQRQPAQPRQNHKAHFGLNPTDKVLLFFGYIRHYKGLDLLLEAMALLVKKDSGYHLLIGGECYEDPDKYRRLIDDLGLKEKVFFKNEYIPNEGVSAWFEAADVVVLPYRSATQSGILNMAYGFEKPVISTNVGGLAEFIEEGKTGLVVEKADPVDIAKGIETFFNELTPQETVTAIRDRVAKNGFSQIGGLIQQVHTNLIKPQGKIS